ncbi:OmpA family protein [Maritimibacter sp. DP1N21-5]|uniref:OmpA family protein n=1 Tax=Maritimibacter sp. DP1N21-5 TaxID=2836867 RepID=UPI001C488D4C|nr:OmpA family protein [Maritimibacter sp. DP1N21-5]MBV7408375.1 OmpA family protein [Maritimibacter sp. DP1N21-5]
MRVIGAAFVLIVGIGGLALWSAQHQAPRIEDEIRAAAGGVVTGAIHPMAVTVSGRDISLSGTADTPEELGVIKDALDEVDGRRVVDTADVTVLPVAAPYDSAIAKGADGSIAVTGNAPSAALAETLAAQGVPGADTLPLASGAPEGWSGAMLAGHAALAVLDEGSFALAGTSAILSGLAKTPEEAKAAAVALEALPEGFERLVSIDVRDTGQVAFDLRYDAAEGIVVNGAVPETLGVDGLRESLGGLDTGGDVTPTYGTFAGLDARLEALSTVLPDLNWLSLRVENGAMFAEAEAAPGLGPAQVAEALKAALNTQDITVRGGEAPQDGATRTNAATGASEVASAGYWLTLPDLEVSRANCTTKAQTIQAGRTIGFVSGSAQIDAASIAVVNDLAGLLLLCTKGMGMQVQIGGHTDDLGDEMENYRLSIARANAVRDAVVARGVPANKVQAFGYGATEPVADNATDQGRAANRRTTFTWP